MIERTGSEHEIGIESKCRDPMSVIFQRMQEFTLQAFKVYIIRPHLLKGCWEWRDIKDTYTVWIPDAYCSVARSGVQHTLAADTTASPSNEIYAGRMSSKRVL